MSITALMGTIERHASRASISGRSPIAQAALVGRLQLDGVLVKALAVAVAAGLRRQ